MVFGLAKPNENRINIERNRFGYISSFQWWLTDFSDKLLLILRHFGCLRLALPSILGSEMTTTTTTSCLDVVREGWTDLLLQLPGREKVIFRGLCPAGFVLVVWRAPSRTFPLTPKTDCSLINLWQELSGSCFFLSLSLPFTPLLFLRLVSI